MAELRRRTPRGLLRIAAGDAGLLAPAAELALLWESRSRRAREVVPFAGRSAYLECDVLVGWARFASAWRTQLGRGRMARMRELENLAWLRDRLFQTPMPLAAGYATRRGIPYFRFLLCEEIPQAVTLDVFLRHDVSVDESQEEHDRQRRRVLEELARELARMHSLRFVHGDLTPAHVLVGPTSQASRIHLFGPSRGGPRLSTAGSIRDVSDFAAHAGDALLEPEVRAFAAAYAAERRAQGRPVDEPRLTREIGRRQPGSLRKPSSPG